MTNKPMLSERDKFEAFWRSTMNVQDMDLHRCEFPMTAYDDQPYACHETERGRMTWMARAGLDQALSAQQQGEPVAYWYVGDIDGYGCLHTTPDKDGIKLYAEQPTPMTQAVPAAWAHEDGLAGLSVAAKTTWPSFVSVSSHRSDCDGVMVPLFRGQPAPLSRCSFCDVTDYAGNPWSSHSESVDGKLIYRVIGCKDHKHLVDALDGSKSTPVEDHTQCEECKGWGYHENHHEGGGTECGECGGSGNATVAVVMPERDPMDDPDDENVYEESYAKGWNEALAEVARLNGVKP